jgi:hypothetical protein
LTRQAKRCLSGRSFKPKSLLSFPSSNPPNHTNPFPPLGRTDTRPTDPIGAPRNFLVRLIRHLSPQLHPRFPRPRRSRRRMCLFRWHKTVETDVGCTASIRAGSRECRVCEIGYFGAVGVGRSCLCIRFFFLFGFGNIGLKSHSGCDCDIEGGS